MEIVGDNGDYKVVPIKLSQEEYEALEKYAACNYTPEQIAICLDVDVLELKRQLAKPDSLVYHHYHKGLLESNFLISEKLLENAKSGNITAVDTFQKRQESVNLHNLKRKYLNGGY